MVELFQFEFMQYALLSGLLASIICGVIGTLIVLNRIVFLSGGIAHAAYGGIGIAFYFGLPFVIGTIGFSLGAAMVMAAVTMRAKHRADTIIGVLWAVGMAIGVILLDLTPGYHTDLMSYLFGSILTVPQSSLLLMCGLTVFILGVVSFLYHGFLAMSYDEEFALLKGVPVRFLYFLLIGLTTVSIVLLIRVVGLILVIALLTIPPYIAERYATSLWKMMVLSSILSALFTVAGLWLSYTFNLTSGASIILMAGCGFLLSLIVDQVIGQRKRMKTSGNETGGACYPQPD